MPGHPFGVGVRDAAFIMKGDLNLSSITVQFMSS